jgi:hypothetical protein
MKSTTLLFTGLSLIFFISCTDYETNREIKDNLEKDIYYLASDEMEGRSFGTRGEEMAAQYLAQRFEEIGLLAKGTEGYFQKFSVQKANDPHQEVQIQRTGEGISGSNVIGAIDHGATNWLILGAHFDHLGYGDEGSLYRGEAAIHNGADDNASGTAALIELGKLLQLKKLNTNVLLIGFSGEEKGLWGSNYFTKNPTIDLSKCSYMINLDMIGRLNTNQKLAIHGVGTSPEWSDQLNQANADSLQLVTSASGIGPSDHTSFYLEDIPVLHFFTGQHQDYHQPTDDADKINYDGLVKIIRMIERLVANLDQTNKLTFTPTQVDQNETPQFSVSLGVVPDYLYDGKGMRIDGVTEGKPAQTAGMQRGDIVVKMGDSLVTDMMSYMRALSSFKKGDQAIVEFQRGDELKAVQIIF